VVADFFARH